ncbi:hypothetical protein RI129_007906 [Pyrocoelia pectoralis]|uniref:Glucose-methanol-choline oxidoreductase N-terminal domain-containing protein n=1 Tax=Pyrocoelia pectoralis TaxID=417401 RepID=A0AAN7ZN88_9COLE
MFYAANFNAYVHKKVILTVGVVGTPQLLMLSGIGQQVHFDELGIAVVQSLPVGQNLQDSPGYFSLHCSSNYVRLSETWDKIFADYLERHGTLTIAFNAEAIAYVSAPSSGLPEIELILIPSNNSNSFVTIAFHYTDENFNAISLPLN